MQLPNQMYLNYILRRDADYELLLTAFENQDVTIFKRIGHQIKGNASSFGFDDLVPIGNKLNSLEVEKLATEALVILDEFKTWISNKKEIFKIN